MKSDSNFLKKILKIFLILFGIFIFLIFILDSFVMPSFVSQRKITTVPNVIGKTEKDAFTLLEKENFIPVQSEIKFDRQFKSGQVVAQNPLPGREVKEGRRIFLTISGGKKNLSVPLVVGKTLRDAKFTIQRNGLQVGNITHDTSNIFPKGTVKFQSIFPNTEINYEAKIDLIISFGEKDSVVKIPNLIGKSLKEAEIIIINDGFLVGNKTFIPNQLERNNTVLEQFPRVNEMIKLNQKIDLIISENDNKKK